MRTRVPPSRVLVPSFSKTIFVVLCSQTNASCEESGFFSGGLVSPAFGDAWAVSNGTPKLRTETDPRSKSRRKKRTIADVLNSFDGKNKDLRHSVTKTGHPV